MMDFDYDVFLLQFLGKLMPHNFICFRIFQFDLCFRLRLVLERKID